MLINKEKLELLQKNLQEAFDKSLVDGKKGDKFVSQIWIPIENNHCPLCGSQHGCMINYKGTAIICQHTMSSKRIGSHSWLHSLVSNKNSVLVQN